MTDDNRGGAFPDGPPLTTAHVDAWRDYAITQGVPEDEARGMNKSQIRTRLGLSQTRSPKAPPEQPEPEPESTLDREQLQRVEALRVAVELVGGTEIDVLGCARFILTGGDAAREATAEVDDDGGPGLSFAGAPTSTQPTQGSTTNTEGEQHR